MTYEVLTSFVLGFILGFSFYFLGKAHAYRHCANMNRALIKKLEKRRQEILNGSVEK